MRRYTYNKITDTFEKPVDLIAGLPSSKDHQSGRLVIGPDQKSIIQLVTKVVTSWLICFYQIRRNIPQLSKS